jgi:hypothetical protein
MQEIIVYRSPLEAAIWQGLSSGEFFPIILGACIALVVFLFIMRFERKVPREHRGKFTNFGLGVSLLTWMAVSWYLLSKLV